MANSIAKAVAYLKEPKELEATLKQGLLTADLQVPCVFVGTNTVKYQHIEFGSYALGNYSKTDGYTANDITGTWKELTLSQDKGNKLILDRMDDEESCANGLVTFANRYILKVQAPSLDTYRFGKILSPGIGENGTMGETATVTKSNIMQKVLDAKAAMEEVRIDTSALILYITPTNKSLLKQAALDKGYWSVGNWDGNVECNVEMFDQCKVMPIPKSIFGSEYADTQFILMNKNACAAMVKYQETEYFDRMPGHGKRKMEVDIGVYHDCFVYDELKKAIFVSKTTASA